MSKKTRVWLIIATVLVLLGLILFAAVMTINRWDFTKLSTVEYQTNSHQITESFNNISIETLTADIEFLPSQEGECKAVCYEEENAKHTVIVQDGTLTVKVVEERKWYEYIGIAIGSPKITVYLPNIEYDKLFIRGSTCDIKLPKAFRFKSMDISISTGDIENSADALEDMKIKTSTGDIEIENVSADMIDLSVSTGKVKLDNIRCRHIETKGSTGNVILDNVIATEKLSVERSTGDVKFDGCDAAEIFVKTSTGDVTGSLLSDKVFIAESDTGSVSVPENASGGKCEITTDTGDIKISKI